MHSLYFLNYIEDKTRVLRIQKPSQVISGYSLILYTILISLRIEVALYKKEYKPFFPYLHVPLPRICVVFHTTIDNIDFPGKHTRQRVFVGTIDVILIWELMKNNDQNGHDVDDDNSNEYETLFEDVLICICKAKSKKKLWVPFKMLWDISAPKNYL